MYLTTSIFGRVIVGGDNNSIHSFGVALCFPLQFFSRLYKSRSFWDCVYKVKRFGHCIEILSSTVVVFFMLYFHFLFLLDIVLLDGLLFFQLFSGSQLVLLP